MNIQAAWYSAYPAGQAFVWLSRLLCSPAMPTLEENSSDEAIKSAVAMQITSLH